MLVDEMMKWSVVVRVEEREEEKREETRGERRNLS
jgi:hypothetical protein